MTYKITLALGFAMALVGCGDDATSSDTTTAGDSTGTPTTGSPTSAGDTSTPSTSGSATDSGAESTGPGATTQVDSSGGEATGTGTTSGDSGTDSGTTDGGESSSGGQVIGNCGVCAANEICVAFEAFMTTYECRPLPAACMGDVDCDCASSLCEDPFVACFDPPEPDQLSCICIAC